ncbi:MMPL family transporter [Streptomyces sp. 7R007]
MLDAEGPMTRGRLREHLGLTSGAVTACVDRLERAGHIRPVRESADRRVVALGVDCDIFLMSRVGEESLRHGVRAGVLRGLAGTGGVITPAGVVLAAAFAALGVIPLAFLVQIAFIVVVGVLLDTLVVRSLPVPALMRDLRAVVWWPGRLWRMGSGTPDLLPDDRRVRTW